MSGGGSSLLNFLIPRALIGNSNNMRHEYHDCYFKAHSIPMFFPTLIFTTYKHVIEMNVYYYYKGEWHEGGESTMFFVRKQIRNLNDKFAARLLCCRSVNTFTPTRLLMYVV